MKTLLRRSFLILILCIAIIACKSDDEGIETSSFDMSALLRSEVEQQIIPTITRFKTATSALNIATQRYITNTSTENLELLRTEWRSTALAAERVFTFNIGVPRALFFQILIYDWPATPVVIENNISNATINRDFIAALAPKSKTLAALEYLLFKSDLNATNLEFMTSEKRRDYIRFSAENLDMLSERLLNIWSPTGQDYANTFSTNTATGIEASFNLLFNGLHNIIATGKVSKIGKPAGFEASAAINPEASQAFFSDTSLDIIRSNMQSVRAAYFNTNGDLGIDDYVFFLSQSQTLNEMTTAKIDAVITAINAISLPLDRAITEDRTGVQDLHTALENLRIFFAVDLRSRLSIIITSTDNDGD